MIQTANVLLSYSLKPLLDLNKGIISLSELQNESDKVFLFDTSPNSNLLRFKHSHSTSESSQTMVTIEIIDPSFRLEKVFANTRFGSIVPKSFRDPLPGDSDPKMSQKGEEYLKSLKENYEVNRSESEKSALRSWGEGGSLIPSFWISYGIGSNSSNWCPPFLAQFVSANLDYSGGSRILTLDFQVGVHFLDFRNRTAFDVLASRVDLQAVEATVVAKSQLAYTQIGGGVKTPVRLSIDDVVNSFFLDYVSKAYCVDPENVIILVPNFSVLFKRELEELERKYETYKKVESYRNRYKVSSKILAETELLSNLGFNIEFDYVAYEFETGIPGVGPIPTHSSTNLTELVYSDSTFKEKLESLPDSEDHAYRISVVRSGSTTFREDLDKILDKVSKNSTYNCTFKAHRQTDSVIISKFNSYGLVGSEIVDDLSVVLNEVTSQVPVIFGDVKLIRDLLYGGIDLEIFPEAGSHLSPLVYEVYSGILKLDYNKDIASGRKDLGEARRTVPNSLFTEISTSEREFIEKLRLPVFRYNVQEPNVLEINLDQNKLSTQVLHSMPTLAKEAMSTRGFSEVVKEYASVSGKLGSKGREGFKNYVTYYLDIINPGKSIENESKASSFVDGLVGVTPEELEDFLIEAYYNLGLTSKSLVALDAQTGDDLFAHSVRALATYVQAASAGTIKTLPTFWLSNPYILLSSCILFALEPLSIGSKGGRIPTRSAYSGVYTIVGFSHTIENGEVSSEFNIAKNTTALEDEEIAPDELSEEDTSLVQGLRDLPFSESILGAKVPLGPGLNMDVGDVLNYTYKKGQEKFSQGALDLWKYNNSGRAGMNLWKFLSNR